MSSHFRTHRRFIAQPTPVILALRSRQLWQVRTARLADDEKADHQQVAEVEQGTGGEGWGVKAEAVIERAGKPAAERHSARLAGSAQNGQGTECCATNVCTTENCRNKINQMWRAKSGCR